MTRRRRALATATAILVAMSAAGAVPPAASAVPSSPAVAGPALTTVPLFAYFYQWFDPSSWSRAKIDYPALGRYSSDDTTVMRQQISWAKQAGINGFVVSWKSTDVDNRRLDALAKVAAQQHFSLAMIYQGLDFSRRPLPVARVAADFQYFEHHFAGNPVFYRMGGKPLTIWSGTWAYSAADVAAVTGPVRADMLVLSTEKSVAGYQRIAAATDGDAYYWSSVNPDTNASYGDKLNQMAAAIHADQKYWIAPFAAGFDARLVGGQHTVDRNDGATLRTEYATALNSSPDALGLISWNEFSENTYVEPSQKYGNRFLQVLAQLRQAAAPAPDSATDSSSPSGSGRQASPWPTTLRIGGFIAALVSVFGLLGRRRRRQGPPPPTGGARSIADLVRHH